MNFDINTELSNEHAIKSKGRRIRSPLSYGRNKWPMVQLDCAEVFWPLAVTNWPTIWVWEMNINMDLNPHESC